MPSICKNVMQASGGRLPTMAAPWTYNYDPEGKRGRARRTSVCKNCINKKRADGSPNCAEVDHLLWTG